MTKRLYSQPIYCLNFKIYFSFYVGNQGKHTSQRMISLLQTIYRYNSKCWSITNNNLDVFFD